MYGVVKLTENPSVSLVMSPVKTDVQAVGVTMPVRVSSLNSASFNVMLRVPHEVRSLLLKNLRLLRVFPFRLASISAG